MIFLILLVTLALTGILLISIVNTFTFPRLGRNHYKGNIAKIQADVAFLSILIPARNEAEKIGQTIQSLLNQEGLDFEVILLDDHSVDNTAEVALKAANGDPRFKIIRGKELPEDWGGKNWACHQLAMTARGEILVFTDADVNWHPGSLHALITYLQQENADMVTVWTTQITKTWGERLVVPLMAFSVLGYLPVLAVHYIPWAVFAAANGQCLVFRRSAYSKIGGHEAVKKSVIEDIHMAKLIKRKRLRLRMMDAAGLISCRMYHDWHEVRDGYAKNILAGHGNSIFFLLISTVFHWLVFLGPWVWLFSGWIEPQWQSNSIALWPLAPLLMVALGVLARALTAFVSRQRLLDSLLMPISVILMTIISFQSIWWKVSYGGPLWKGRILPRS